MKYVTAILASIFIFLAVFVLIGLFLSVLFPRNWLEFNIELCTMTFNILSAIAFLLASVAATYTFKASLHAKTGKLYRMKNEKR